MANKSTPDLQVHCYPRTAIPRRTYHSWLITDLIGDNVGMGNGDDLDVELEVTNPTVTVPWLQGEDTQYTVSDCSFVRFMRDGRFLEGASYKLDNKGDVSGFILKGRKALLDCKIGTTSLDGGNFDLTWSATAGTWITVRSTDAPLRTQILNKGSATTHTATTSGTIPANRSLWLDVAFNVQNPTSTAWPGYRFVWGNKYSLVARHNTRWTVEITYDGGTLEESPRNRAQALLPFPTRQLHRTRQAGSRALLISA